MNRNSWLLVFCGILSSGFFGLSRSGADPLPKARKALTEWPMLGGSPQRNMVCNSPRQIPDSWDLEKHTNITWSIDLGSKAYGGPIVAGGKIFVGTNNDTPRNPKIKGDKGVLMCFRESDGTFLWQAVHDKLPSGRRHDWPHSGIGSFPIVEGNRLYYVSNRCELVCADVNGDGKGGAKYYWKLDMMELQVRPYNLACSSPLILGNLVFVVTGNGVNLRDVNAPSWKAPSFLAVNKKTGRVVWSSNAPGTNIMLSQWSSPTCAVVDGRSQIIFPGGDGWLYAFEPSTGKLLWKFDCNPKDANFRIPGGTKNNLIAPAVVYNNYLYIGVGQNPEHNKGVGHLWCIDLHKATLRGKRNNSRDVSPTLLQQPLRKGLNPQIVPNLDSALGWHYGGLPKPGQQAPTNRRYLFCRTLSLCAVKDALLYVTDYDGFLYCFHAWTGKLHWTHDLKADTWASPVLVNGKVYVGTEGGEIYNFKHGAKKTKPRVIEMAFGSQIRTPVVVANGRLYILTQNPTKLYAIETRK